MTTRPPAIGSDMDESTKLLLLHIIEHARIPATVRDSIATVLLLCMDNVDDANILKVKLSLFNGLLRRKHLSFSRPLVNGMLHTADKPICYAMLNSYLVSAMSLAQFKRIFMPLFRKREKTKKDYGVLANSLGQYLSRNRHQSERFNTVVTVMTKGRYPRGLVCYCISKLNNPTNEMLRFMEGSLSSTSKLIRINAVDCWRTIFCNSKNLRKRRVESFLATSKVPRRLKRLAAQHDSQRTYEFSVQALDEMKKVFPNLPF